MKKEKSARFVAELLSWLMKQNDLVPADIMRGMVIILNPKENVVPINAVCALPKPGKELKLDECTT